jgi:hypothetical protein
MLPLFCRWRFSAPNLMTLALLTLSAAGASAQTPIPSIPAAIPAPASSLPSLPAATEEQKPRAVQPPPQPQQPPPAAVIPASKPTQSSTIAALPAYDPSIAGEGHDELGSTYIPVDSVVYPMALRLYSLGYLDTAFTDMRPWTRRSLLHMLDASSTRILADGNDEAVSLLASLQTYLAAETPGPGLSRGVVYGTESVYTRMMGISGQTLRDSYHLGQTIANDYGRPYQPGFNNITGVSTVSEAGPFSLYFRGEYQHAPSNPGYSQALSALLSNDDSISFTGSNLHQATIPSGPIATTDTFAIQEATLSYHLLGHEISGGKSDAWLSPAVGGAMGYSNNAQDIYSFRIDRVEPMHIPLLSRAIGPVMYDFFVGSLKGHTYPNDPWIHSETVAIAPTENVRISFQRSVVWGGHGHPCLLSTGVTVACDEPINLHTFLKSFFSFNDTSGAIKASRDDPGARFSSFNFSWRLPFLRHSVTLYSDSTVHDDVTPPSAPRRAAYRPGIYLSQVPKLPKLDFRIEGTNTDISTTASINGSFMYFETVQRQGYTNKGYILGDWIGREAKAGQAWLTYHLSPNEFVQLEYMHKKTAKDFIPGGTTQNQFVVDFVKRLRPEIELNAWVQYEGWKAPVYIRGNQLNKDTTVAVQLTWFPRLKTTAETNQSPVLRMR